MLYKAEILSDFNLGFGECCRDHQINCTSFYTACMGFSPYSNEIRQFKIPPIALFEQIAKYSICQ